MLSTAPIPLVDLTLQHKYVAETIARGFERVIANASYVLGPEVTAFEEAYSTYCATRHCVAVANGTDAIELALRAAGIGPGDEVIAPANTFVATAEAIARTGAEVVLADCDDSFLIDPKSVAQVMSERTRAIVPVHLYGQMAPIEQLVELCSTDVAVIEDAAQSQGASRNGVRSGSAGLVAATSFYPGKNLGAYGDAGAITTNDDALADSLRQLRNHGGTRKYEHSRFGVNSRMDGLQAVVLSAKLHFLDQWNLQRKAAADLYSELLRDLSGVTLPVTAPGNSHAWHLFVVRVRDRDRVLRHLNDAGIGASVHYPTPVHMLPPFNSARKPASGLPRVEQLANEILSLPIYPGITEWQQERVADILRAAVEPR